jgi:hypothetical protein
VKGNIVADPGLPRTRPWVTIFPAERELWAPAIQEHPVQQRIRYIRAGTARTFAADVPVGEYFVVATDTEVAPIGTMLEFERLSAIATRTALDGSTTELTLRVQRWTETGR